MRKPKPNVEQLQKEVESLRDLVISLTPGRFPGILSRFVSDKRHFDAADEAWEDLWQLMLQAADALGDSDVFGQKRARCPLCGRGPASDYNDGFTVPNGLERHLRGENAHACEVVECIDNSARGRVARRLGKPWGEGGSVPLVASAQEAPVQPHESERHKAEKEVGLWEIKSYDAFASPYLREKLPALVRWVRGPKEEAEDLHALWVKALRWGRATEHTRVWIGQRHRNGVLLGNSTLVSPSEQPEKPRWDSRTREWVGPEPVIVDLQTRHWVRFLHLMGP